MCDSSRVICGGFRPLAEVLGLKRMSVLLACTAVLVLVPAGAAVGQQYPPADECTMSTNLSVAQAGSNVVVTGTGFPTGPVEISVNGQLVATATAASAFTTTITIPANATPPFVIRGVGVGGITCTTTLLAPGAAGAAAAGRPFAFTGSDSLPLVWIGLAALITGLALIVAVRRRSTSQARSRLASVS
jgi:LPXTG-motif cell wall-anchored protein